MQTNAVEQLGFIGGHEFSQGQDALCIWVGVGGSFCGVRHRLVDRHALQHHAHVFQQRAGRQTQLAQGLAGVDDGQTIAMGQGFNEGEHMAAVHAAQHVAHRGLLQFAIAKGDGLIGEGQRIAHRATRGAGNQAQGLHIGADVFVAQHLAQVLDDGFGRHGAQIELQTARQHGDRHLVRVGGGQDKFQILGRLFQGFEHGVERRVAQHVHLVDHEDLEAALHRFVNRLLQQLLHLVHAPIGGGVQLGVIHKPTGIDLGAGRTHATRFGGDTGFAIQGFGQDARHRGLAHTPRAGEQIGVVQALRAQRIGERLHDVRLPHQLFESFGTVFAGQHQIGHPVILRGVQFRSTGLPAW